MRRTFPASSLITVLVVAAGSNADGLVLASVILFGSVIWLLTAFFGARSDLDTETGYNALEGDLSSAIEADQVVFNSAASGADALDPLTGGIAAASMLMALGCGWAITRRLAEYR